MESILCFVQNQIPSYQTNTERFDKFVTFLSKYLTSTMPVLYSFNQVPGDGMCLFHAVLRFFARIGDDLPNLDIMDTTYLTADMDTYTIMLDNLKISTRNFCREHLGNPSYEHDESSPEYELICTWIAQTRMLRVIVIEIDIYKQNYNTARVYKPNDVVPIDTMILLNSNHHFYLVFPTSISSDFDTKTIRELVGNHIEIQD